MAGPTSQRRVLVVEDDASIRELLRLHLDLAGFTIDEAGEGRSALERARATPFDLVLLDVMLPGLDGVSVCRAIRNGGPNVDTPILMLTAREGESDKVLGLESGADDYLTKPFGVRELMARISALMRRRQPRLAEVVPSPVLDAGDLSLDRERRTATVRGGRIELTKQEFDLLYLMASRPGAVFTRAALLQEVWSDDTYVTDRTVDTVISRLRRKIERDPQDPAMLLTAWGVGYKFSD
jgi:two-component system, OmpR family, alkaline phosphatase synthesis response regulator PhoP